MHSGDLAAKLNAGYVCPPEAGPAWRQAIAEGVDMSLIEHNLSMNPWERLGEHDEALQFAHMLQQAAADQHE